jgi:hypothetical protein
MLVSGARPSLAILLAQEEPRRHLHRRLVPGVTTKR